MQPRLEAQGSTLCPGTCSVAAQRTARDSVKVTRRQAHLYEQPVQAARAQALGLAVQQQAADDVGALGLEVRMDGVHAPPEVQAVGKVEGRLVLHPRHSLVWALPARARRHSASLHSSLGAMQAGKQARQPLLNQQSAGTASFAGSLHVSRRFRRRTLSSCATFRRICRSIHCECTSAAFLRSLPLLKRRCAVSSHVSLAMVPTYICAQRGWWSFIGEHSPHTSLPVNKARDCQANAAQLSVQAATGQCRPQDTQESMWIEGLPGHL